MPVKIRGVSMEGNLDNSMGLEFYDLSHPFGLQKPNWPYFQDVQIEPHPLHGEVGRAVAAHHDQHASHTHIDAPAHVIQGTPFMDEVPLPHFFGSGIVISIPKKQWEQIGYDDLEKAAGKLVRPRDVVIVNTGWHEKYEDSEEYFCLSPGFVKSAGEWFVEKKVKVVGHDTQANDHPLATAIGPHRNGPIHPHLAAEYKKWSGGPRLEGRFPGLGAGAPHPVQQRHPRHRECRRRDRQGHGLPLHLRDVPVALGARRRLHHPPGRHGRPEGRLPDREGGALLMKVKRFSELKTYDAPNHRGCMPLRVFGAEAGGTTGVVVGVLALPARRRCRAGRLAAREGLFRAGRRAHRHRRRQGDGAEAARCLHDRTQREPRDHQSKATRSAPSW